MLLTSANRCGEMQFHLSYVKSWPGLKASVKDIQLRGCRWLGRGLELESCCCQRRWVIRTWPWLHPAVHPHMCGGLTVLKTLWWWFHWGFVRMTEHRVEGERKGFSASLWVILVWIGLSKTSLAKKEVDVSVNREWGSSGCFCILLYLLLVLLGSQFQSLKYEASKKNQLFSRNNNVGVPCGVGWCLGWLGGSPGPWPLVRETVLGANWLCRPPRPHSEHFVLAHHWCVTLKKSSRKVQMDSCKSVTFVRANKTKTWWWMSHENV